MFHACEISRVSEILLRVTFYFHAYEIPRVSEISRASEIFHVSDILFSCV